MPQNRPYTTEICVDTAAGIAACLGLVDRIELCAALDIGGVTPSDGMMRIAAQSGVETHVLIRPKTGDFTFDPVDLAVAVADIQRVRAHGLQGVVIGAVSDGMLDRETIGAMIHAAGDLDLTLHRAFDVVDDQMLALEQAIDLGFRRILTSGGAAKAVDGIAQLARLQKAAHGRIEIMAGSGVNADNLTQIGRATGIRSFHASCGGVRPVANTIEQLGFGAGNRFTDQNKIKHMIAAADQLI